MELKRHDLKIYSNSDTHNSVKEFVQNQEGVLFRYHPLEEPLDKVFLKSCMESLINQAREVAEPYAQTQNKTCGEIHEMKIINQTITTKDETSRTEKILISDTATHTVHFNIQFSFLVIQKKE